MVTSKQKFPSKSDKRPCRSSALAVTTPGPLCHSSDLHFRAQRRKVPWAVDPPPHVRRQVRMIDPPHVSTNLEHWRPLTGHPPWRTWRAWLSTGPSANRYLASLLVPDIRTRNAHAIVLSSVFHIRPSNNKLAFSVSSRRGWYVCMSLFSS